MNEFDLHHLLENYPGKTVVLLKGKVIAFGSDIQDAFDKVNDDTQKRIGELTFFAVPSSNALDVVEKMFEGG